MVSHWVEPNPGLESNDGPLALLAISGRRMARGNCVAMLPPLQETELYLLGSVGSQMHSIAASSADRSGSRPLGQTGLLWESLIRVFQTT